MTTLSFRWLLIVTIGIAGLFTLLGKFIMVLIYGKEFLFSGQILAILAWSEVAVCYGVVISQVLISQNLQNYLTISTFIGAIINIVGNIIIIPYFGVIGSSWVTVFSYAMAGIFLFSVISSTRSYNRLGMGIFYKIMLIGIASIAISSYLHILAGSVLFTGIYILGLILTKLLTKDDLTLILRTIAKPKISTKPQVT